MNNTRAKIKLALKSFLEDWPQPNLESEACQDMLVNHIHDHLTSDLSGTLNLDQLTFFTEFDGGEHK